MTTLLSNTTPEGVYLADLGPNDVLLGRGTGPNENRGNVKFRSLLKKRIDAICNKNPNKDGSTDPCNARQVAIDVIDTVREAGGHFVRKLTSAEIRTFSKKLGKQCRYVAVEDKVAREKTKQSIRFQIRTTEKNRHNNTKHDGIPTSEQQDEQGPPYRTAPTGATKTSKSALAILEAKQRARLLQSSRQQDPLKLGFDKASSLMLSKAFNSPPHCAAAAGYHLADPRLLAAERSRMLSHRLPSPSHLLLGSSSSSSSLLQPVPTAADITSLLAAEQAAAHEQRLLAHEHQKILLEQHHVQLFMARQEAAAVALSAARAAGHHHHYSAAPSATSDHLAMLYGGGTPPPLGRAATSPSDVPTSFHPTRVPSGTATSAPSLISSAPLLPTKSSSSSPMMATGIVSSYR